MRTFTVNLEEGDVAAIERLLANAQSPYPLTVEEALQRVVDTTARQAAMLLVNPDCFEGVLVTDLGLFESERLRQKFQDSAEPS